MYLKASTDCKNLNFFGAKCWDEAVDNEIDLKSQNYTKTLQPIQKKKKKKKTPSK